MMLRLARYCPSRCFREFQAKVSLLSTERHMSTRSSSNGQLSNTDGEISWGDGSVPRHLDQGDFQISNTSSKPSVYNVFEFSSSSPSRGPKWTIAKPDSERARMVVADSKKNEKRGNRKGITSGTPSQIGNSNPPFSLASSPPTPSRMEASPLRQFIVSEHRRRKNEDPVPREYAKEGEEKSKTDREKRNKNDCGSLFYHPCQFQNGGPSYCNRACGRGDTLERRDGNPPIIQRNNWTERVIEKAIPCPYANHPSVCCLSTCGGKSVSETFCYNAVFGLCPWHHGEAGGKHRRLVEALFMSADDVHRKNSSLFDAALGDGDSEMKKAFKESCKKAEGNQSLGDSLKEDAEAAAASLSVFVDAAVVAMEVVGTADDIHRFSQDRSAPKSTVDYDAFWSILMTAVQQFSQTSDGSYVRCIDPAYLHGPTSIKGLCNAETGEKKKYPMLLAVETTLLDTAVMNVTNGLEYPKSEWNDLDYLQEAITSDFTPNTQESVRKKEPKAEWWYGPVSSSVLHPSPPCRSDPCASITIPSEGFMILSPLLRIWLIDQVCEEFRTNAMQSSDLVNPSPKTIVRKRLRSAICLLIQERLRMCDSIEKSCASKGTHSALHPTGQKTWYDDLVTPTECALLFTRDAVIWSLLRVLDDDEEDGKNVALVIQPTSALTTSRLTEEDFYEEGLPMGGSESLLDLDPATAALRGVSSCSGDGVVKSPSSSLSLLSSFLLDWRKKTHCSLSPAQEGLQEKMQAVDDAWEVLHLVLLRVYHIIMTCSPSYCPSANGSISYLDTITKSARIASLVQPAFIFLCQQHSRALETLYGNIVRSSLGWTPWTDAQMFEFEDREIIYTPVKYARYHLSWLYFSCYHSLLNGLLLSTLLHSEHHSGLCHKSAIKQHVLVQPHSSWLQFRSNDIDNERSAEIRKIRCDDCNIQENKSCNEMTDDEKTRIGEWSHRERVTILSPYLLLSNGFLSALHDLGGDLKQTRELLVQEFEYRRVAYSEKSQEKSSTSSNEDYSMDGGISTGATSSSRTRRYNEETWKKKKELHQKARDAASTPLLDRLLPHGTCIVSPDATSRLLRQWLEGGAAYRGLRVAAGIIQTMRVLRRAANAPLPRVEETTKIVHRRVQSKKNPYKKQLIQVRVPTHRLVVEGTSERFYEHDDDLVGIESVSGTGEDSRRKESGSLPPLLRKATTAFPLVYHLSETVVEEIARLSLRVGIAGARLVDGVVRECVNGNVLDFFGPPNLPRGFERRQSKGTISNLNGLRGRALPYPTPEEIAHFSKSSFASFSLTSLNSIMGFTRGNAHDIKDAVKTSSSSITNSPFSCGSSVRQNIQELLQDSVSGAGIMNTIVRGEKEKKGGWNGVNQKAVLVASRVPPTADLMEIVLTHSGIQVSDRCTNARFGEGSASSRGAPLSVGPGVKHSVLGYILTDPNRFLTPEVLLAVQGTRSKDSVHQAMGGVYCVLHCICDAINQKSRVETFSPPFTIAKKMLAELMDQLSDASDISNEAFFRSSYSSSSIQMSRRNSPPSPSSVSSLAKEFLLQADQRNHVSTSRGDESEAVSKNEEILRGTKALKYVRQFLGLLPESEKSLHRVEGRSQKESFHHQEFVSALIDLPEKNLYGLIIECCCLFGSASVENSSWRTGRGGLHPLSFERFLRSGWCMCAATSMSFTLDDIERSPLALQMSPSMWRWTLCLGVLLSHSPASHLGISVSKTEGTNRRGTQVFHRQQYWMDAGCRVLLLSELLRSQLPSKAKGTLLYPATFPLLSSASTPVLDTFPSLVIIQILLGRHLMSQQTCHPGILWHACQEHLREQGLSHDTAAIARHRSALKRVLDQLQDCVLEHLSPQNNKFECALTPTQICIKLRSQTKTNKEPLNTLAQDAYLGELDDETDNILLQRMIHFVTKEVPTYSRLWKFILQPEFALSPQTIGELRCNTTAFPSTHNNSLLITAQWLLYTLLTPTTPHQHWVYYHLHRQQHHKTMRDSPQNQNSVLSHRLFQIWITHTTIFKRNN